jgi:hypothetical protein
MSPMESELGVLGITKKLVKDVVHQCKLNIREKKERIPLPT